MKTNTKKLVVSAIIAALYAVLTICFAPISYGPIQFRISEILTVLPIFTACAVPGLTLGCIIANLVSSFGIYDVIFGSLATLIGALGTYYFRKRPFLATLAPVLSNAIIVGSMLCFVVPDSSIFLLNALTVGAGEFMICVILGLPLIHFLKKHPNLFLK